MGIGLFYQYRGSSIMHRRAFLTATVAVVGSSAGWSCSRPGASAEEQFEIVRTEAEWRKRLTPEQFAVLREHDTEPAGSSPLDHESRTGTFECAGCGQALFSSATKFDSGTGWPSFTAPLPGAVGTSPDRTLLILRTEVHCSRCGGHLGHVFDDGPPPTGKRYRMNGDALTFVPA
jgi:peptide-methionine (R)-S-oxide reductase